MLIPRPCSVFIDPIDDPDMSPSGLLYVPTQAKERTDQGIVRYVGEQCRLAKIGDWVLFNGYAGTLVFLEGEGRLISMDERDIVAICGPHEWASTQVPGLYYKDKDGNYFTATFESALDLLKENAAAFMRNHVGRSMNKEKIDYRPSLEDIERATNWPDHIYHKDD